MKNRIAFPALVVAASLCGFALVLVGTPKPEPVRLRSIGNAASNWLATSATAGAALDGGPPPADAGPLDEDADDDAATPTTLPAQREALFVRMSAELGISDEILAAVRALFEASSMMGQGNPAVSKHPMTRKECRAIRAEAGLRSDKGNPICGARYMVPLFDPGAEDAGGTPRTCIDQFEFPDIPCEYPVIYVRAREAAQLCQAMGKRICDAHEWEGACAGEVRPPELDYAWGRERPYATWLHNRDRAIVWAYGPKKDHSKCATKSRKSKDCEAGGWNQCGSNTYPAGAFPSCRSRFGVYDQHGNAAEHMNLPMGPAELTSAGGTGQTEMKGSWFIFAEMDMHEDDCRWRAKDWHPSPLMDIDSHRNYHLGFRCCKDIPVKVEAEAPAP